MTQANILLQVVLKHVRLFPGTASGGLGHGVLRDLAEITGIPQQLLQRTEQLIAATGSLDPLHEILRSHVAPKATTLQYELNVQSQQKGIGTPRQRACQGATLSVRSQRGHFVLTMVVRLAQLKLDSKERQSGRISMRWQVTTPSRQHTLEQEYTLAATPKPQAWAQAA